MSALKYGIIYWAKIECLIASRHISARGFNNREGLSVLCLLKAGSRPRKAMQCVFMSFLSFLVLIGSNIPSSCFHFSWVDHVVYEGHNYHSSQNEAVPVVLLPSIFQFSTGNLCFAS